jgi:CRP-like cAMP-binding protein
MRRLSAGRTVPKLTQVKTRVRYTLLRTVSARVIERRGRRPNLLDIPQRNRAMNAALAIAPVRIERNAPAAPAAPEVMPTLELEALRQHMTVVRRKLTPGQYLCRAGQPFHALYLVHAGFLKSRLVSSDGREQITGFHLRGDLLAVDSIGAATHACDVMALDFSEVWELPYPPVLHACMRIPSCTRA